VIKPKVEGLLICLCVVVQKSVEMNRPLPEHAILSVGGVCEPVEKVRSFGCANHDCKSMEALSHLRQLGECLRLQQS
jgi:hypothetical protein